MSEIRPATADDLHRCRRIQSAALTDPWSGLLTSALEGEAVFLVVVDGEPIGYALALAAPDAPAYVPEFAVAPDRQSEGHGTRLMTGLLEQLATAGHGVIRLTVRADDDRARAFYRAHGFELVERRPDHYENADGLLLERRLDDLAG
ncbi:MAG: N-acetyltransferase [Haloarculaceae archaeon]